MFRSVDEDPQLNSVANTYTQEEYMQICAHMAESEEPDGPMAR